MERQTTSVYEFGKSLIDTGDLDPVYIVAHGAQLEKPLLYRWLLAYWCFYHVGTACWIADRADNGYWQRMAKAAGSKDYPRSTERRHYRGSQATSSVSWLRANWDRLFEPFDAAAADDRVMPSTDVIKHVTTWRGFGPWIAFKVADMLERLGVVRVHFTDGDVLYDSPRKAAALLYETEKGVQDVHGESGAWAMNRVLKELNPRPAPPRGDRELNWQEAETVLCKWGSHVKGHYKLGEDVAAVKKGLLAFQRGRLCQRFLKAFAESGL